ncbi:hypothetical protein [Falsiroseomonas stagni]|uniref:Uncharacterized protein n=1 Tax=Falsiroseomonas stagni DSM 19981 TaxID=1123062 RepID=A0A1I3XL35_9PROT|nr:hypothetical protein [Falsiroseomonas stagni]SFK20263.1 hypothetical protein SAMN02745775_101428 [Falsiroseomonas stagni DSM 19981]
MLDSAGTPPDLTLLLGPHDAAEFVAFCEWRDRLGRCSPSLLYVVVHRRGGESWTQAIRILPDRRPGHLTIHVERIRDGDERAALRAWLLAAAAGMKR